MYGVTVITELDSWLMAQTIRPIYLLDPISYHYKKPCHITSVLAPPLDYSLATPSRLSYPRAMHIPFSNSRSKVTLPRNILLNRQYSLTATAAPRQSRSLLQRLSRAHIIPRTLLRRRPSASTGAEISTFRPQICRRSPYPTFSAPSALPPRIRFSVHIVVHICTSGIQPHRMLFPQRLQWR